MPREVSGNEKNTKKDDFDSKEEVEGYQFSSMKRLITHAYETVPYYHKLFNDVGFHPENFYSLRDLKKI